MLTVGVERECVCDRNSDAGWSIEDLTGVAHRVAHAGAVDSASYRVEVCLWVVSGVVCRWQVSLAVA